MLSFYFILEPHHLNYYSPQKIHIKLSLISNSFGPSARYSVGECGKLQSMYTVFGKKQSYVYSDSANFEANESALWEYSSERKVWRSKVHTIFWIFKLKEPFWIITFWKTADNLINLPAWWRFYLKSSRITHSYEKDIISPRISRKSSIVYYMYRKAGKEGRDAAKRQHKHHGF